MPDSVDAAAVVGEGDVLYNTVDDRKHMLGRFCDIPATGEFSAESPLFPPSLALDGRKQMPLKSTSVDYGGLSKGP